MKFSEMPYQRPDPETVKKMLSELTNRLKTAADYEQARTVFLERQSFEKSLYSAGTIADIRYSLDTRDKFYEEENNFWNDFYPELDESAHDWTEAMLASPFRKDFPAGS